MKKQSIVIGLLMGVLIWGNAQESKKISTIDFVQIIGNNKDEVLYYYQNNWKVLREMAIANNYIQSFDVLETAFSDDAPFQLILITTYKDEAQFKLRDEHFKEMIEAKGELKLLNDKKPDEFRKIVFNKEEVLHWK
ncbi:MAG: hypothetical protein AAF575_00550 [Bacteroidota bacterium]